MTKTTKIQLISKNDDILDYKEVNKLLWQLQKETRAAANRCIQLSWEYSGFESDWKKNHGEYPTRDESKEVLGKTLSTAIYNRIKQDAPSMNTGNLSMLNQSVCGKFNTMKTDILRGTVSIPCYKNNMPIELHKKNIKLDFVTDDNGGVKEWIFELSLFSRAAKQENNLASGSLKFKAIVPAKSAKSVRTILERCYDEVYSISGSKLKYDNGKWFLLLCYSFDKSDVVPDAANSKNIMGVHIAKHNAVYCMYSNSKKTDTIDGGEVLAFTAQIEQRKRSIGMASSKHSVLCGDGRVGHGYHAKMKPLDNIGNKISNFRNTTNHRYSRQIVNWAVKNKCGVIQVEDLTGLAADEQEQYTLLKNWSYYDLMSKIEYKAKECGIKVIKVGYKGLRKWCADCQSPSLERRKNDVDGEFYVCTKCRQAFDINYDTDDNVARALIVENINELLKESEETSQSEQKK